MKLNAMLTVDLNNVSSDERNKFYEKLKEEKWQKLKLTTTWIASFTEKVTLDEAIRITKSDVQKAAAHAGISNYEAASHFSENEPVVW